MDLELAVLALALARRFHGTASAVKLTAKRAAKRLPGNRRAALAMVLNSRDPIAMVDKMVADYRLRPAYNPEFVFTREYLNRVNPVQL